MEFAQYRQNFVQQLRVNAQSWGRTPEEEFVFEMMDRLESMDELVDPFVQYFGQRGPRNALMKIDGYSLDPADKTLVLFQSDFRNNENPETITRTDLENSYKQMMNFLTVANDGLMMNYCDESNEYVKIAEDLRRRLAIKYVNDGEDESIEKIRLIVLTNASLSERVKNLDDNEFLGRKVEREVWSIERLFELDSLGLEREAVEIDTAAFGVAGIPCIRAELSSDLDYDAYLAVMPGRFLSDVYYKYGSRLLEGNVRAFLSNKGKINQGIRRTILTEPTKFFTYNNGIACTAESVTVKRGENGPMLVAMKDFQIINGGQTTASLTSAFLKDGSKLEQIFVPVKITVIRKGEDYDSMVSKISKYANSQNKVTDADFFSNHPFHVEFERLSKQVVAPAVNGSVTQTMWYYERSRGKYNQEMFKMKESEKAAYQTKFPKSQVIKKEELAKYYNTIQQRPWIVVLGSAKNMAKFAEEIDSIWSTQKQKINEEFFRRMICAAIMFRETDKIVAKAPWYEVGGFKSQVIPYTIAKLLHGLPEGYSLDFDKIWRQQTMYLSLSTEIERLAQITNEFIQESNGALVSEYVKRKSTWDKFVELPYAYSDAFLKSLVDLRLIQEKENSAAKDQKLSDDLDVETKIFSLGSDYWNKLLKEGLERKILGPMDIDLLKRASTISQGKFFPNPRQSKELWKLRERLGKNGVLI